MTITRTFEVVDGQTIPDVSGLDAAAALARKRELERMLAATRGDPARVSERDRLRAEDAAVSKRLAELKEATKLENQRRNFAGIGSPLHEAIVARFDPATVAELERDALARLAERGRRTAERKAPRGAAMIDAHVANKSAPRGLCGWRVSPSTHQRACQQAREDC